MTVDEPLLDITAVSKLLSIKPCTLYAWAAQGRMPSLKIHGLLRFRASEINHWLKSIQERPRATTARAVRTSAIDIATVIARVKRDAYTRGHGETRLRSSPIRKEETDGAV